MNAIEVKALTKKYRELTAVDALTLTVGKGEFFSLLGVNGAGKTTAIKMLTGLAVPTSGDALIMGHSVVAEAAAIKAITNVSPQETAVAPKLSVIENLRLAAGVYGMKKAEAAKRAEETLHEFKLDEVRSRAAQTLSGGWKRRLSIAMAMVSRPEILYLDEPTLGLDVIARRELWREIRALKGKITIILTTHYLEEAQELSDRVGIMAHGRLCALGTVPELLKLAGRDSFEEAFVELAAPETEGGERA